MSDKFSAGVGLAPGSGRTGPTLDLRPRTRAVFFLGSASRPWRSCAIPRWRITWAALMSALDWCPHAVHQNCAWLGRFSGAVYPHTAHSLDELWCETCSISLLRWATF